jgi:CBS domain-containing protein
MAGRSVGDVMTTDVVSVHPDASFKQVVRVLAECGVDGAPVVDEDGALLGVVSGSDLTCHEEEPPRLASLRGRTARSHARKSRGRTARDLMSSPARTTGPSASVCEALAEMGRGGVGRLVVVQDGRMVGILTRSDVLRTYLRSDRELQREVEQAVRAAVGCPSRLAVSVDDGVVRLSGWVERTSCAWAASGAARAVAGVVDVEDLLTSDVDDTVVHELSVHGPFV